MNRAEKALQYFIIAVPEDKEQAEAYFWARRALNAAVRSYRETYDLLRVIENQELIARAEAAEARAEKAEKERDAAISDIETIMAYGGADLDTCEFCKNGQCYARCGTKPCLPKWRGQKEE